MIDPPTLTCPQQEASAGGSFVGQGIISEEKAMIYADSPSDLRLKLRGFV
jgi:hypothetical protein